MYSTFDPCGTVLLGSGFGNDPRYIRDGAFADTVEGGQLDSTSQSSSANMSSVTIPSSTSELKNGVTPPLASLGYLRV